MNYVAEPYEHFCCSIKILTTNDYDHVGRLLTTKKKVNAQTEILQSKLVYNEIGQLKSKGIHSENSGTNFLTNVTYAYNERGWGIKTSAPQFTYELNYNLNSAGAVLTTGAQYNGNIAQQLWGHAATISSTFVYTYDALNRLKNGTSTGTVMSEALTYDDMGNIKTLTRDGGTTITYAYNNTNKSNRLLSLTGGLTGTFTYDLNGNATKDRTGMAFTYNQLNLPKTAAITGRTVAYVYDATGTKLKKTATVAAVTTEQDYVDGIEYSKLGAAASAIERIATEEGFLLNSAGVYSYHYNLTDHLGNVRSVIKQTGTAAAPIATVVQKQDYYPFGKTKSIVNSINSKYLYNGKETAMRFMRSAKRQIISE
ncbi:RHS repeat-associated core domain-containing protein [Sphingobacterium sp. SRCM116780]|uniref:RHS repeat-associated core domain-containing protein n=1 Tax=Sphingobacterium sp. SRCM116780 TaxID=2907623 RepID=UPI001F446BC7|nr:RHS repeat-associated core domain-containing protein [Sphingobacterium sp. SRCM116780]UIR57986.1 RHS repeat-associated core domain-containing protein [Sphingobacterium sp. SRCM116780]